MIGPPAGRRRVREYSTMHRLLLCCVPLLLTAAGCATVVGTVTGPVTGPLHADQHSRGAPPWFRPFVYPLSVPLGAILGFCTGAAADVGFVLSGGEYGAPGYPGFDDVLDPTAANWGRPTDAAHH
jgi:hypothetical protein